MIELDSITGAAFKLDHMLVMPLHNQIIKHGQITAVEPLVMNLLVILSARAGEPISRGELFQQLWGDTIVTDDSLTLAVSKLRRALGDHPTRPRYIETLRKRGYRLIMDSTRPAQQTSDLTPTAHSPVNGASRWTRWSGRKPVLKRILYAGFGGTLSLTLAFSGGVFVGHLDTSRLGQNDLEPSTPALKNLISPTGINRVDTNQTGRPYVDSDLFILNI